ncbi:uncharacterized protein LOC103939967 isoform X4 [Pyrus x bretschneideri]|uniref:uncharacterized protein LOC103939967 isoform X4 n=1 Tax=Pyrus x bretschneideri TaxID=225117 RepID=UPI00202DD3D6|nr:uncharacterized protein LOC103939967 isoform X4 [Pyrus x bretschneideri]
MLFLLKTCHKFKTRRDLESKTEQLLHSEMTPTSQQTQLLQFQLQFLKKELGISFSHNMDDECKKLIHRITPPSCIHNYPRHSGIYYNKRSNFPSLETPQARNKSGIQALHSTLFSM